MQQTIKHNNKLRHRFGNKEFMMLSFFRNIKEAFFDITVIISGDKVETKNSEIKKMMSEIYNIDIPNSSTDRANLKKDGDAVVEDYKAAVGSKMTEGQD